VTLAQIGVVAAVVGTIAFAIHADAYPKLAQRRSDCAAWRHARATIASGRPARGMLPTGSDSLQQVIWRALGDEDAASLLRARELLGEYPQLIAELLPALRDPSYVGLRNPGAVTVDGHGMPFHDCGTFVMDDLFMRAGRASWLLKQATGHPASIVAVKADRLALAPIAYTWEHWLEGLDGGEACRPF
jgi:uncharacterized membrane protein